MTRKTDWEAEYNNRAAVPDHPVVMARWRTDAEAARADHPPAVLSYGPGGCEIVDLFQATPTPGRDHAPVAVFIHGGYWQALNPSWFSWVAPPLLAHGVSVAIAGYDLCPDVSLGRIVEQMRQATGLVRDRTGAPPLVFGHSAGGHLAACMLSEGQASAAVAISGVFDLRPLIETSLNAALRLDATMATALSPIFWPSPGGTAMDCVVGAAETAEFIRQSRDMADLWASRGVDARFQALEGLNHFTVLDPLADPDSALVKRIAELSLG